MMPTADSSKSLNQQVLSHDIDVAKFSRGTDRQYATGSSDETTAITASLIPSDPDPNIGLKHAMKSYTLGQPTPPTTFTPLIQTPTSENFHNGVIHRETVTSGNVEFKLSHRRPDSTPVNADTASCRPPHLHVPQSVHESLEH